MILLFIIILLEHYLERYREDNHINGYALLLIAVLYALVINDGVFLTEVILIMIKYYFN